MALQRSAVRDRLAPYEQINSDYLNVSSHCLFLDVSDRSFDNQILETNIAIYQGSCIKLIRGANSADTIEIQIHCSSGHLSCLAA